MNQSQCALVALFIMTACWGATFPFIHIALHNCSPVLFVVIRNIIASMILLPIFFAHYRNTYPRLFMHAAILGVLNGFSNIAQTIGLTTLSSSSSAFITAINVVLVPFLLPLFKLDRIRNIDLLAAGLSLVGVYILSQTQNRIAWQGLSWTLACAVSYAAYICALSKFTQQCQDVFLLVFYQIIISALFPLCLLPTEHSYFTSSLTLWGSLLFCGVIATALALLLQNFFQRYISAATAAIIYLFEPIFAALLGAILIHEAISLTTVIGGSIILGSFLISHYLRPATT